jgi:uncharacterized membrane protein
MLLLAQAFLLALSVLPVWRFTRRRLDRLPTTLVVVGYALCWPLQGMVDFDFHEVAFAVPIVSLSVTLLGMRRHRAALIAAAPLVLIKEDLGISYIAALGVILLLRREWLLGTIAIVGGLACSALEIAVIIPAFNPDGVYGYASNFSLDPAEMLKQLLAGSGIKIFTVIATLIISAFIALRSPLLILVLANLRPRMLTSHFNYYGPIMHYSAIPMALVLAAMIDGLIRIRARSTHRRAVVTVAMVASITMTALLWAVLQAPDLLRLQLATPGQVASLNAALAKVPDGTTVLASDQVVPHLAVAHDANVLTASAVKQSPPEWIVSDPISYWPQSPTKRRDLLQRIEEDGYTVVFKHDGVTVMRRDR